MRGETLNDDALLSILQVRGTGLMGEHGGGVHEGDECKVEEEDFLNEPFTIPSLPVIPENSHITDNTVDYK